MIATIIILAIAFIWLGYETKWFTIRLESTEYQKAMIAQGKVNHDVNHDTETENVSNYPMTLTTDVKTLKDMIDQLSKTELELTEEVYEYDYSNQT